MKSSHFQTARAITTDGSAPFFAFLCDPSRAFHQRIQIWRYSLSRPVAGCTRARFYSFSDHLFKYRLYRPAHAGMITKSLHVEQTEYDQSIGAYDSGIIRRFSDYLVTVQYEVDGTRYTADLSLGQAFFTGNRVARARCPDGSSVLGTIFYKSSDPKRLKYIPARRHILPFSTGKYVCRRIPMILPHRSARFYSGG